MLKMPVTIRHSGDVVEYFKGMVDEAGVPSQSLINCTRAIVLPKIEKRKSNGRRLVNFWFEANVPHGD